LNAISAVTDTIPVTLWQDEGSGRAELFVTFIERKYVWVMATIYDFAPCIYHASIKRAQLIASDTCTFLAYDNTFKKRIYTRRGF